MIILYCANSIWIGGGIEHVTIAKANAMADMEGNSVLIAVADNRYPPTIPLDPRIQVIDLGLHYFTDESRRSRFSNLLHLWQQNRRHKKRLNKVILQQKPDIIISTDGFEKHFLPTLRSSRQQVFIREYHMWSKYRLAYPKGLYERVLGWLSVALDNFMNRRYDKVVLLTREDKERHWKHNNKVIVIPNPCIYPHLKSSSLENKTVCAVGRLCRQKNFGMLIRAWSLVNSRHPEWVLEIWGQGPDKVSLQQQIQETHLEGSVYLKGYDDNLILRYASSSIFVLSSIYEGFSLVLLEALSCGLPIVSTNCPCGPKDLIFNGKNGFLVSVGDEVAMADRICYLMENPIKRKEMGAFAKEASQSYKMENIVALWMNLFQTLWAEKRGKE